MSKIVCDICGTSYAETAKQCPICGSVRPGDAQCVTNEVKKGGKGSTGYTHVKGGRFTKSNVKKRTKAQSGNIKSNQKAVQKAQYDDDSKVNRGLVLMAIMLLLAIIGVVAYIAIRFFVTTVVPPEDSPTINLGTDVSLNCTELTLESYAFTLNNTDVSRILKYKTIPEKPSEPVLFESKNPAVATVSDKGVITPVSNGKAEIIVTCGKVSKTCVVTVELENQSGSPDATTPDATTPDNTEPNPSNPTTAELRLNRNEFTLSFKGERWDLYTGGIPRDQITWTVGDRTVATVENGVVVAVANGYTYVYAEYNGQKVSCQVICAFEESSGVDGSGGVTEDGGGSSNVISGTIYNVTEFANLRKGPGTSFDLAGQISLNAKVTITEQKVAEGRTWGKIGTEKWVSMEFVKVD